MAVVVGLFGVGCLKPSAVQCEDGTVCPPNTVCDLVHHQCVTPDQLTSCSDKQDGDSCPIATPGVIGICRDGVCLAVLCGDGLVQASEQCDGAPPATTCIDSGYDAGFLGCLPVCAPAFSECHRIGWKSVAVAGTGVVREISAAGDVAFATRTTSILRFDGVSWAPMTIPSGGDMLFSVFTASNDRAFVATESGVLRYDGTSWQSDPTAPSGSFLRAHLAGTGPSDVYLFLDAAVHQFDGQGWSMVPGAPVLVRRAWASPGDVWAVDGFGVLHRGSGTQWSTVTTPLARVDSVRGFGSTVYIAGRSASDVATVARWNGTAWEAFDISAELGETLPAPPLELGGRGASDLYAFGAGTSKLVHFNGSTWQRIATVENPVTTVTPVGDQLFAGTSIGIARESPSSIADISDVLTTAGATVGGSAVWGSSCNDVFVASASSSQSDGGKLFHFDGAWVLEYTHAGGSITDVFGASDGAIYATTTDGFVLRRDGATWSVMQSFPSALRAVWAAPGGVVVTAGDDGWIHRFTGTWTSTQVPTLQFQDVWGISADDLYAVRRGASPLVHFDGSQWTDVPLSLGPLPSFSAIWGDQDGNLIVVGQMGIALHREGGIWRQEDLPFDNFRAVHGSSVNDVFAIGDQGTIAHFDGIRWSPLRSSTTYPRSIWTAPSCTYIAGDYNVTGLHRLTRRAPW